MAKTKEEPKKEEVVKNVEQPLLPKDAIEPLKVETFSSMLTRAIQDAQIEYIEQDVEQIAKVCHTANLGYCQTIGDDSQVSWGKTPDNIKISAVSGVIAHLKDHNKTPEQSHQSWMDFKIADGWVFGEEKNIEKKTHYLLIPYEELELKDKIKDYIFRNIVHAFLEARGELKKEVFDVFPAYSQR